MKTLIAATLLLVAPMAAHACSPSDFAIQDVKVSTTGTGLGVHLSIKGKLVNHCSTAAAAQVRLQAKDASGNVLASREGWPNGTSNLAPGQSVDFDMGRLLHFQPEMQSYSLTVVSVRTW